MRISIVSAVALAFVISGAALAQDKATSSPQNSPSLFSGKPLTVSGKVSADGKKFLTDIDSEWSVSNADALKGHEGRLVRVKCYVDTEKNSMRILSVRTEENRPSYTAQHTDSAFRR